MQPVDRHPACKAPPKKLQSYCTLRSPVLISTIATRPERRRKSLDIGPTHPRLTGHRPRGRKFEDSPGDRQDEGDELNKPEKV
jgi:hypothetical protein